MSKRQDDRWTVLGDWTRNLLEPYREQITSRELLLSLELDPHFVVIRTPAREVAFEGLLRMIFETTPDRCEIYLSCQRSSQPVSPLGVGEWIARWQILVDQDATAFQSKIRDRLEQNFVEAGWELEIVSIGDDPEFLARVRCREPLASR